MTTDKKRGLESAGFSLVEVVLAVGIFSFALVVMLAVFGGTYRNTRSMIDLESLVAVREAAKSAISRMSRSSVFGTPSGEGDSSNRPEVFLWITQENSTGFSITNSTDASALALAEPPDSRIYRARLYRALSGVGGAEAGWNATQAAFPLRVQLDAFVDGAYSPSAKPVQSSSFNAVWRAQ